MLTHLPGYLLESRLRCKMTAHIIFRSQPNVPSTGPWITERSYRFRNIQRGVPQALPIIFKPRSF